MMKYRISVKLPDNKAQIPPIDVDVDSNYCDTYGQRLGDIIEQELANDYDQQFGLGTVATVERIK